MMQTLTYEDAPKSFLGHKEECECATCQNASILWMAIYVHKFPAKRLLEIFGTGVMRMQVEPAPFGGFGPGGYRSTVEETLARLNAPDTMPLPYDTKDGGPAFYRLPGTKCGKGVVKRASKKRIEKLKNMMEIWSELMPFFRRPAGSENLDNLSSAGCTDMMRRLNNLIANKPFSQNDMPAIPQQKTNERSPNLISEAQENFILSLAAQKGQTERYTEEFVKAMTKREASATIERLNAMSSVAPVIGVGKYNLNGDTVEVVQNKTKTGFYCYVNGTYANNSREIIASLSVEMKIDESAISTKYKPEEGMYIDRTTGQIYRAKVSRESGNLYGMRWELFDEPVPTTRGRKFGEFVYDRSVMSRLTADMRMSYEEACAIGTQFHFCIRCGIELIHPDSIARGMGDTCAGKF